MAIKATDVFQLPVDFFRQFLLSTSPEWNQDRSLVSLPSIGFEIRYSNTKSRHIVATRDFKVGEIIYKENPVFEGTAITIWNEVPTQCCWCHQDLATKVFSCEICNMVTACSKDCWEHWITGNFHDAIECQIALGLKSKSVWGMVSDARLMECLVKLLLGRYREMKMKMKMNATSRTFDNLFHLESNLEGLQIFVETWRRDIQYLIDALPNWLLEGLSNPLETLLTLSVILHSNSYAINTSGMGLFYISSFLNHSCIPNVSHSNDKLGGPFLVIRATRDIAQGEELVTTYGIDVTEPVWLRNIRLWLERGWVCRCLRCRGFHQDANNSDTVICDETPYLRVTMDDNSVATIFDETTYAEQSFTQETFQSGYKCHSPTCITTPKSAYIIPKLSFPTHLHFQKRQLFELLQEEERFDTIQQLLIQHQALKFICTNCRTDQTESITEFECLFLEKYREWTQLLSARRWRAKLKYGVGNENENENENENANVNEDEILRDIESFNSTPPNDISHPHHWTLRFVQNIINEYKPI